MSLIFCRFIKKQPSYDLPKLLRWYRLMWHFIFCIYALVLLIIAEWINLQASEWSHSEDILKQYKKFRKNEYVSPFRSSQALLKRLQKSKKSKIYQLKRFACFSLCIVAGCWKFLFSNCHFACRNQLRLTTDGMGLTKQIRSTARSREFSSPRETRRDSYISDIRYS